MALMEPFCRRSKIDKFKRWLGYHFAYSNCNNKIWIFCDQIYGCTIIQDTEQQVTCTINAHGDSIIITAIYAKCKIYLREPLWDDLRHMANNINIPWLRGGDFNCVLDASEKKGGNTHKMSKSMPPINCIIDCSLIDPGYIGSTFTWCNGRGSTQRMWERLDRAFINYEWSQKFINTTITHLIRTSSDHSPLFITIENTQQNHKKYFKFLNLWVNETGFLDVVKHAWNIDIEGSSLWRFHLKLKHTYKQLSWWSKN
ncbi:uncharacterized protein LOC132066277 [Lycium ferocissimum]|uniref:uncharacterized protein LOC132066277 n=1 Tax=Lycium ferocissimum TaxID=112874 RepID=UPI0028167208|nr:uncharacterized protein LOC132066277 [Lycium ferocissimum]